MSRAGRQAFSLLFSRLLLEPSLSRPFLQMEFNMIAILENRMGFRKVYSMPIFLPEISIFECPEMPSVKEMEEALSIPIIPRKICFYFNKWIEKEITALYKEF
jgi:hypothetical protein